jgi:hypothetical protein
MVLIQRRTVGDALREELDGELFAGLLLRATSAGTAGFGTMAIAAAHKITGIRLRVSKSTT